MGGSYFIVRDIFQELKLKPKAYVPIVAKALSEVSPSVPYDASSHFSPVVVEPEFQVKIYCFGVISLISLGFTYHLA